MNRIHALPRDIFEEICKRLSVEDHRNLLLTNKRYVHRVTDLAMCSFIGSFFWLFKMHNSIYQEDQSVDHAVDMTEITLRQIKKLHCRRIWLSLGTNSIPVDDSCHFAPELSSNLALTAGSVLQMWSFATFIF